MNSQDLELIVKAFDIYKADKTIRVNPAILQFMKDQPGSVSTTRVVISGADSPNYATIIYAGYTFALDPEVKGFEFYCYECTHTCPEEGMIMTSRKVEDHPSMAFNLKEVRVGNWVEDKYDSAFYTPTQVNMVDLWNPPHFTTQNKKYIPITGEILKAAGMHYDEIAKEYSDGILHIALFEGGNHLESRSGARLRFVHQLQNLYHAITGNEIEIKLGKDKETVYCED